MSDAIAALRSKKGLPAALVDPVCSVAAQAGADAWAVGADEVTNSQALASAQGREGLHSMRPASCVHFFELLELGGAQWQAPLSRTSELWGSKRSSKACASQLESLGFCAMVRLRLT